MKNALTAAIACLLVDVAAAQCPRWEEGFGAPGMDNYVSALAVVDQGRGPELLVGGHFDLAAGVIAPRAARWDGSVFGALGQGPDMIDVFAVVAFDDGGGPAVYAGGIGTSGNVSHVQRWNGSSWSIVGDGPNGVYALAVYDAGLGAALYAGDVHGRLWRWDGAQWSIVASAVSGVPNQSPGIFALCVRNEGAADVLYAGGSFVSIDGVPAQSIARFDGSTWTAVGAGLAAMTVGDVEVFDDGLGGGPLLYACGGFDTGSGSLRGVVRFDGSAWSEVGGGVSRSSGGYVKVAALQAFDDGSGPALYATGNFDTAGALAVKSIARWNGTSWSALGSGLDSPGAAGLALGVHDEGGASGPALFVGGYFFGAGGVAAHHLARWQAGGWSPLRVGSGLDSGGTTSHVAALLAADDPAGGAPSLFAGGSFQAAGAITASRIARWDGAQWSALGTGIDGSSAGVRALAVFADGLGPRPTLYATGSFEGAGGVPANHIARWDGASWAPVGAGVDPVPNASEPVRAMAAFGGALYVGGHFTTAGGASAINVARWDGSAWSNVGAVGVVFPSFFNNGVHAMTVFDDGGGADLVVGGFFTSVTDGSGTHAASMVARFDGTSWSQVGNGLGTLVNSLAVLDDGAGPELYAGTDSTPSVASKIWKLSGATWVEVASFATGGVVALAVFDDGAGGGPALYASNHPSGVLKLEGTTLVPLGTGVFAYNSSLHDVVPSPPIALAPFDDASGELPALFVGGRFDYTGGRTSRGIGAWRGCNRGVGTPYCFGDGSLPTACPCAPPNVVPNPPAAPGHGCANSFHLDGAVLSASGSVAQDAVELHGSGQTPIGFSFFVVGTAEVASGVAIADGIRCAGGALTRFGSQNAVAGTVKYPNPAVGWTLPLSAVSGTSPGSGATKHYQVYYRNAQPNFCGPGTANLTNAYRLTW